MYINNPVNFIRRGTNMYKKGNQYVYKQSRSHDQDGCHAHIYQIHTIHYRFTANCSIYNVKTPNTFLLSSDGHGTS